MAKVDYVLAFLRVFLAVWDILTWPIYQAIYRPWVVRESMTKVRSKAVRTTPEEIIFEAPEKEQPIHDDLVRAKCDTMDKAWKWAVQRYGQRKLLGTRDILSEEDEVQANGKVFRKYQLGEYRWLSYEEADVTSDDFGRGMRSLGLSPHDKVCIFADTRAEWYLSALACFKQGFPLVTLYTNLGEEAIIHGINQVQATHIITSHDLIQKFKNILHKVKSVTNIVYFEDQIETTDLTGFPDKMHIDTFWDVVSFGRKLATDHSVMPDGPEPCDSAIIMFTSGSTGVPKGVVLSHRNMYSTLKTLMLSVDVDATSKDCYIAFLPLAHSLELLCETMMCMYGIRVGYSTPNTLLDKSSMVKKGCLGDASKLQPTIMAAVPLILDRVYKTIKDTLSKKGEGFERLFQFCFEYRRDAVLRGEGTPILDMIVFRSLRSLFGGKIRVIFAGGAPLSKESHEFIHVCMGCPVLQGYGLTETTACATVMEVDEMTTEACGPPNQGVQIMLVNWEEGNYRITDKPRPRGEVIIGGNCVAEGYYQMPEKTAEEFYEAHGRRWFRSGDIGEMLDDGTLKVIDRKKDLVKLQFGEYVSLGKVESCLKTCPIVENVCIYGDATKSYTVALVCPDRNHLAALAVKFGKDEDTPFEKLCEDRHLIGAVLRELVKHGKKHHLERFEIPGAVTLCKETWLPDTGLVTAAFKLRRKPLQDFYQKDIDRMYGAGAEPTRGV